MIQRIGIIGKMFSGKTTLADAFVSQGHYRKQAFASPLKNVTLAAMHEATTFLIRHHGRTDLGTKLIGNTQELEAVKSIPEVRKLIQDFGNFGRHYLGPNTIWTDIFSNYVVEHPSLRIVCDDCRMPDEAAALRRLGFFIIKLERDEEERVEHLRSVYGDSVKDILSHESERFIDTLPYDITIQSIDPPQLRECAGYVIRNGYWYLDYARKYRSQAHRIKTIRDSEYVPMETRVQEVST